MHALISIYEATTGNSWNGSTGWQSDNLDNWLRVTLVDKRVTELNLSDNNLSGSFPMITSGLEELVNLNLSNNELTFVADLANLGALQDLDVSGGALVSGGIMCIVR